MGFELTYETTNQELIEAKQNGEPVSDPMRTYLQNHPQFAREVAEKLSA